MSLVVKPRPSTCKISGESVNEDGAGATSCQLLFREKFFHQAGPKALLLHAILANLSPVELRQESRFFAPFNLRAPPLLKTTY
ncbi:uncharacterized protein PGTG_16330 [Puccinia graminis f. sp. tritici CRL 75-36-700-3]|uniref:Uncharacterized protein n=1 Tax=Puccinia graminis f. sp. tritici (strain CRL 75-36-700-3 / race SCCL) TaxID=418459 RepID=E3L1A9_PUCGT|nr:uncharacterized protein PGTG_16330 [Puccinia graminis f. sp. tritici CRL 75-36-700-3]EFP90304.2 hypothetical protein PGTG_16330 [Puccinia graminis f. sp. tritici CRL 75-36-700-3]